MLNNETMRSFDNFLNNFLIILSEATQKKKIL